MPGNPSCRQLHTHPAVLTYPALTLMQTRAGGMSRVPVTLPCCIRRQSATALTLPCCDLHPQSRHHPCPQPSAPSQPCSPAPPLSPFIPEPPSPALDPIVSTCTHTCACAHAHIYPATHHMGPVHLHSHLRPSPSTSHFCLCCLHVQTSSHVLRPVLTRPNVCKCGGAGKFVVVSSHSLPGCDRQFPHPFLTRLRSTWLQRAAATERLPCRDDWSAARSRGELSWSGQGGWLLRTPSRFLVVVSEGPIEAPSLDSPLTRP